MSTRTLTTTLPSGTLYVSGTVNGVSTTWTNTEGNTWETVAERSPQDVYVVALTIINQLGAATETTFTLYYGLHLVTDRTQADVNAGNAKGTYNASDLNRVGAAMNYVADRLLAAGYDPHISPKTDWKETDYPTPQTMERYLGDLAELRGQFSVMQITPTVPKDMVNLTYQEANDIERILEDVDALITNIMAGWFYSGELYAGEV